MQSQHAIDWNKPDCLVSKYFSVREVTQNDEQRIPSPGSEEEINILSLAAELDLIREAWDGPIGVTSWNRPYWVNKAIGGATSSQHITGAAADIYPIGSSEYEFEEWLDQRWGGALGYGAAAGRGFTHVDLRGGGFDRGQGDIRWSY